MERKTFREFYHEVFLPEHSVGMNVAAHILGTLLALAFLPVVILYLPLYLLVLFPVLHAGPGLIGHRLFERNAAVGDVRVTRKDYPNAWFMLGNHIMTAQILGRLLTGRGWRL